MSMNSWVYEQFSDILFLMIFQERYFDFCGFFTSTIHIEILQYLPSGKSIYDWCYTSLLLILGLYTNIHNMINSSIVMNTIIFLVYKPSHRCFGLAAAGRKLNSPAPIPLEAWPKKVRGTGDVSGRCNVFIDYA